MARATRPRILVLTTTLPARAGDGTPEFVLTLAQALADRFDITILAPRVPGGARSEEADGVSIRRFPYFPRSWESVADGAIMANLSARPRRWLEVPSLLAAFTWHAARLHRRIRPAVVHAHWIVPSGLVATLLHKVRRTPFVLTIHGADAYALNARPFRRLKTWIVRDAAISSPVSRDIADRFRGAVPGVGERVVPMGVRVEEIREAVGRRSPEPGRFLFVGRLAEKKGMDVLLRALRGVPGAHLSVAGDGPDRTALEELARSLDLTERVSFLGKVPRARVIDELRRAQILVLPSKIARGGDMEGTPVVLAEGMAAGVPIIASSLGGIREHIVPGQNGVLTEPGSVESLAEAMRTALSQPDRLASHGAEASGWATRSLDIRQTADRYAEFYENAARRRDPGART